MTRLVSNALLTAILVIVGAAFAATQVYPFVTGTIPVRIVGNSMEPTIGFGSLAYAKPLTGHPEVGDIVTFQVNKTPVTHRVIASWSGHDYGPWLTQGDNSNAPDAGAIRTDQIIGKVTTWVPGLGLAMDLLGKPPIIAFVMFLAATLAWVGNSRPSNSPASQPMHAPGTKIERQPNSASPS